ncbi:DUF397 domain-containing protein [Streptomonospora wellingtoniae]|uniref:DUF397 domain-containing protein n=1 Tax=Streptomonospora wellingtoniae TaxID=3075544 RepID=A0ABU2KS97_9ACTN|nr:DUF397 domain-containing protein [Streptomonospora sp. DSM 45055]MDT0302155.1 DUF397 domain-containing protein [Streptomonospora sp. DSM 45055]
MSVIPGTWRKSSYSNSTGGDCVEVANTDDHGAAVRDTKNPNLAVLALPSDAWATFLVAVKSAKL